jgi:uncharacterized membrane protein
LAAVAASAAGAVARAAAAPVAAGDDMNFARLMKHMLTPHWIVGGAFPRRTLDAIEQAIGNSEKTHDSELRFAVEAALHPLALTRGLTARQRAIQVFSELRVWDTQHNSGVLIYVQLADRRIEIVADRGISAKVPQEQWDAVCRRMEDAYRKREFEQGTLTGIAEITRLLATHFPPLADNPNELSDAPVVL